MSIAEAKYALAGVVVGGLLTGAVSVYVEFIKGIRDDVRYRAQTADEILKLAAETVKWFSEGEVLARKNDATAMPSAPPLQPDQIRILVGSHFPDVIGAAEKFTKACDHDFSDQHGLAVAPRAEFDAKMKAEPESLTAVITAYKDLRTAVTDEVIRLNSKELSKWYVLGVAP